ncbi:MAG: ATP-dependent exonuclease SbcCD, C subunit-like protein [Spirochaetaceae bacterium]|nr:MAG: ATP-dependent exonuclease SbcCD, C subunit-like protein [Spirochaetaceae bacterium]
MTTHDASLEEGLFDFAADDTLAGFRLQRLEVFNWGTFHGRTYVLPLDGRNGLLTGDIGSGKSTMVDAVNTLLVPPGRITFNRAAGGERRERDMRSYVLGHYRSERTVEGSSSKPVALRAVGSYSVILGVFYNQGFEQTVSLAQVLWQRDAQAQPARFYIVADRDLSIREHFSNFGSDMKALRKRLRDLPQVEPIFDSFPQYSAAFRRRLGLKSEQALMLFHQTVSMKAVGNLTEFVREHMLEPFDVQPRIEALLSHFEDLTKAHEAVLRAKDQIARLSRIEEHLQRHHAAVHDQGRLRFARDGLQVYFAKLRADLLEESIKELSIESQGLEDKRVRFGEEERKQHAERDRLRQAIADNGGDRLEKLLAYKDEAETEKARRIERYNRYSAIAKKLDIPEPRNEEQFLNNRALIEQQRDQIEQETGKLQNDLNEQGVAIQTLRREHEGLADELESLAQRRSNIDAVQISMRRRMCDALGIEEERLPFAGELLQIRPGEEEWEGAAERLLRSFGLSLLVPSELYGQVSDWVDGTDLRGRLVYFRVRAEEEVSLDQDLDENSLVNKIEIKPESELSDWLLEQLKRRFDYTCCRTMDEFRRSRRALTRAGQIKGSATRHEKDDRHPIGDRRRYILGWRNDAKIQALQTELNTLEQRIAAEAVEYSRTQQRQRELNERKDQLYILSVVSEYTEINWSVLASRIEDITEEIRELQQSSDVLATLGSQLEGLEHRIKETRARLDKVSADLATVQERLRRANALLVEDQQTVDTAPQSWEEVATVVDEVAPQQPEQKKLTVDNAEKVQQELRSHLQTRIDAVDKQINRLVEQISGQMQDFRREYPSETLELDASVEAGDEFMELLRRLRADDLPRFETRFKTLLNENAIREIANFNAQLSKESGMIKERIEAINKSLESIEYEKDRYIRLEAITGQDPEVRSFQQELRNCTTGSVTGSEDDQYAEAKFALVKAIIDRFRGREGSTDIDRRWTQKVTDVRYWYSFAASERWREDDTEYEHYTDSGGKSGGQKEKLAYTVLAASVAYQFGLEWGEKRSRSFRFVVIDEAFGRGSDESARFGLRLFKELNLQLLIVTPLQKIHIIEPYVSTVGFVYNQDGKSSQLQCLSIEQYRAGREQHGAIDAADVAADTAAVPGRTDLSAEALQ